MTTVARAEVDIRGNLSGLNRSLKQAESNLRKAGRNMQSVGRNLTAAVSLPIAAIGAASVKMASDAEEAANKFDVVMGDAADSVRERLRGLQATIPLTTSEMDSLAAGVQDLLVPLGIARNEAAGMSADFVELAGDLSSFNNVPTAEVLEAINSGLAGQSRPLRQFGIDISVARLKTIALSEGLIEQGEELNNTARAQAVFLAATRDSADAQGDAARTVDSTANQMRLLTRDVKQLGIDLGKELVPIVRDVIIPALKRFTEALAGLSPKARKVGIIMAGVAAAIGPLLLIIGGLASGIGVLLPVLAALTGPVGLVVAGVGLAIAAFFKWREEITGFISDALEPLKPIFASIMEVFKAFGGLIVEIAGPILEPLAKVLGVVLIGALQALVFSLQVLVEALNLTMVPALKGVTIALEFMTEVFGTTREFIGEAINAIIGFVVNMVQRIRDLMGRALEVAFGPALRAIDKVKGAFKGLFDAVVGNSFIPEMVELIGKHLKQLDTDMVGQVTSMTGRSSSLFGQMRDNISASVHSVLQMVRNVLAELQGGGGGILGGIVGGITGFLTGGPVGAGLGLFSGLSGVDLNPLQAFAGGGGIPSAPIPIDPNAFAGPFARGGLIPAGQFGLVGERGPEFISGPAQVTPTGGLTLRVDTSAMPPMPRGLSPTEAAIHSWYRQLFSEMVLDGRARGVL